MARSITGAPAIIVPKGEKPLGHCGYWPSIKKKIIVKNAIIRQNTWNNLMYFTLMAICIIIDIQT
jgi:hypothetical protein